MIKQIVITQAEVEAEHLTQSHGLFVQKDAAGRNYDTVRHYVMRRLREAGMSLDPTRQIWRKFKDVHGKCVWIAEEKVS